MEIKSTNIATAAPFVSSPQARPASNATAPVAVPVSDGVSLSGRALETPPQPPAPAPSAPVAAPPARASHEVPPAVLQMTEQPAPQAAAAGPNLLQMLGLDASGRAVDPLVAQLGKQLSLDSDRAQVAANLVRQSGIDAADSTKGPMLANYADLTVKTAKLGLAPDSFQMRMLEKVLVANLKEEQAAANGTHVWNVGDGALDIGNLLNSAAPADKKMSPQELGNRVVAAMLHDPPNKKPMGPSFLLHNKFAANRADKMFAELAAEPGTSDSDRKAMADLSTMAQRRALDHHVAPSWMAFSTVGEAAKALPSLQASMAGLSETEQRQRLDALNGVIMGTVLVKGVDPAVGLPSGAELQKTLNEKNLPVTRAEAETLVSLSGKLLDPIHAEQLPPDAEHKTYRVKFNEAEQTLLDSINSAYRGSALAAGAAPEEVGKHFDWYAPPNVDQFPHAKAEQEAALHMIAADGLANYAKADAFLVKAPDGSATPGKFLGFYTAQGPEVAYKSAQGTTPGGSYHSYLTFLGDMPAVAEVAGAEHARTASMVGQTLDELKTSFAGGYLSLDPKSSFEPWREGAGTGTPAERRDAWVTANLDKVLPQANNWRAASGLEPLRPDEVHGETLGKVVTAYQSAYTRAFATRLNELDASTPKVGASA